MSDFYDDDDKDIDSEEEFVEADETLLIGQLGSNSDARRKLESLLEEKRLRDELEDFLDY